MSDRDYGIDLGNVNERYVYLPWEMCPWNMQYITWPVIILLDITWRMK